ncbi:hypothetical protein MMC07_009504 [Pseudocyphellaria aurata]|nr:hypothetical protein [Pseudocyphellaria aurata]
MHLPPIPPLTAWEPSLANSLLASSPDPYPPISSLPTSSLLHTLPLPPNLPSHQLEQLPGHLHPITRIHLSTTSRLLLKTAPSTHTLLLRHERHQLASEANVLALLAKSGLPTARLLKHSGPRAARPFILTTHLPGIAYALVRPYLTRSERLGIKRQLSAVLAVAAQHTSPRFGPVALVAEGKGFDSWREAFGAMVDSVLMDAEDTLVALPYAEIRHVVQHMGTELDDVREARLVLGWAEVENEQEKGEGQPGVGVMIDRRENGITGLVGLVGLGGAFWGDPRCGTGHGEDGGRSALYSIYTAITAIVTNHYRPRRDATELDARKVLTRSLAQLATTREVEVAQRTGHRG